jgi:hypothetical protein
MGLCIRLIRCAASVELRAVEDLLRPIRFKGGTVDVDFDAEAAEAHIVPTNSADRISYGGRRIHVNTDHLPV